MSKKDVFSVFRYQINPISQDPTELPFDEGMHSADDLIARKNQFFHDALTGESIRFYGNKGKALIRKIKLDTQEDIIIKLGVKKLHARPTQELVKVSAEEFPFVVVYVDNRPERQYIFIQHDLEAFTDPNSVKNYLWKGLRTAMYQYKMFVSIQQVFDEREFWQTIKSYEGRIKQISFEIIRPNISSISDSIKQVFGDLQKNSNSQEIDLTLKAPDDGALEHLNQNNEAVSSIVNYQKDGGGPPPKIKIMGLSKMIKTVNSETIIEVQSIDFDNIEDCERFMKSFQKIK